MSKIKVAIIGCGCIAESAHIPSYMNCEDAEIKYFCDIIIEKAQKFVDRLGVGTAIEDYHIALEDPEIDAISVCTPNLMHSIITIDALRAGKHVLCEKPAARILDEALQMQQVQHETGKTLNIGVVCRFNAAVNDVRRRIMAGDLGEVYHVFINFRQHRSIPGIGGAFTTKAIAGGGVLIDWGVHRLDQVLYCLGDPNPVSVSAATYSKLGCDIKNYAYRYMWSEATKDENGTYDVEESVTALVRTEGPVISLEGAWAQNIEDEDDYIDFIGTKAGIRLKYCGNYKFYGVEDGKFYIEEPDIPDPGMFQEEINAFVRCVQTGERERSHIDNAIITARIMQGIYDSAEQNKEIVL
ncbi:MAG: Gfo/Idh/MocA family oxidoreductase [Clostridia bacterium]|nr:Gfo/Idh/MocA family oxidoreductase [Clostridia bacterium]